MWNVQLQTFFKMLYVRAARYETPDDSPGADSKISGSISQPLYMALWSSSSNSPSYFSISESLHRPGKATCSSMLESMSAYGPT